jgi:cation transport ATPase
MKRIFGAVYVLVLLTQLPHVGAVYAGLERAGWYQWTAWGAAVAFELSIGLFTYQVIRGARSRWTRAGLGFFLVASAVANATYYSLAPLVFRWVMPLFATLALPLSLALFAEEFGTATKREERRAQRAERQAEPAPARVEPEPSPVYSHQCQQCEQVFVWPGEYANSRAAQNALNAHQRRHNGHGEKVLA